MSYLCERQKNGEFHRQCLKFDKMTYLVDFEMHVLVPQSGKHLGINCIP